MACFEEEDELVCMPRPPNIQPYRFEPLKGSILPDSDISTSYSSEEEAEMGPAGPQTSYHVNTGFEIRLYYIYIYMF